MVRKNPSRKVEDKNDVFKTLEKMKYGIVGKHSAVQICRWTKNSLRGEGECWKEKIYGISSSGCCQMTPSVMWCENSCLHCWRPIEMNLGVEIGEVDDPIEILEGIVEKRKELLAGFRGNKKVDLKKFEESLVPKLYTFSLSGEPTLYPWLGEMFKEIRRRGAVSFLITNGLNPSVLSGFKDDEFPTQITVSVNAPNEKLFNYWHRSTKKNAWKEFNKTLVILKKLKGKVRRAIRLTLVKPGIGGEYVDLTNMADTHIDEYTRLIKKAEPDFIHVKGFKAVGYSRERLGYDKQVWHDSILEFSNKLVKKLGKKYEIGGEYPRSCVVMIKRKGVEVKIGKV
ncbi:MAG: radical SAM protein [archaeon]